VDDKPYVSLVDTHTKGYSRDYHLNLIVHPIPLDLLSPRVRQLRVVKIALDLVVASQVLSQAFAILPRNAIDDARFARETRLEHYLYIMLDVLDLFLVSDFIEQIGSVKATLEVDDFIGNPKSFSYVILNFLCGCGRQSKYRTSRESFFKDIQVQIIFAEVLTPVRNAMNLIDHKPVDLAALVKLV